MSLINLFIQSRKILLSIYRLEYLLNNKQQNAAETAVRLGERPSVWQLLYRVIGPRARGRGVEAGSGPINSVCNISFVFFHRRPPGFTPAHGVTWLKEGRKKKQRSIY